MMLQLLEQLKATTGKAKITFLEDLAPEQAEMMKMVAEAAYNSSINYYISTFKIPNNHTGTATLREGILELTALSTRLLTGNSAREYLTTILISLSANDAEVLARIVRRDLRVGCDASTFNEVWPNLIYQHPYMRCSSFNEKNLAKLKFPAFSQTKEDGAYVDIIVRPSFGVEYRSRSGEIKDWHATCNDAVFMQYPGFVFQGEALLVDGKGNIRAREDGNGKLNSDELDTNLIRFVLWDMVKLEDWEKGESKTPYETRYNALQSFISQAAISSIVLVDTRVVSSVDEAVEHFRANVYMGKEGTVIKNKAAKWKDGTSPDQVKVKVVFEVEVKITDIKEGSPGSKYEGMLGAFEYESVDGIVCGSVGSGFKDKDRVKMFDESYSGIIITIAANDVVESRGKPGKKSLYLPRFKGIRTDKTEADSYDRIVEQMDAFAKTLHAIKTE